jgi:recombination protein RecT
MYAASLDLPFNQVLGFAFIVPFKKGDKIVAQFQIGYKGFIQLAQRSGLFKSINSTPIYKGQIVKNNPLDGFEFDFNVNSEELIGYAAKFVLLNGFESIQYMTIEEIKKHSSKYSNTYRSGKGFWIENFDAMARKTVLKLLLSRYAPLSIDMQKAVIADQSVITDSEFDYVDNKTLSEKVEQHLTKEDERLILLIQDCKKVTELIKYRKHVRNNPKLKDIYNNQVREINSNIGK